MFVSARKMILGLALAASLVFAVTPSLADPSGGCVTGATTTCTFDYTGAAEAWVVPTGVTSGVFDLSGAQGGSFAAVFPGGSGGKGGHVQATVALTAGETLHLRVGGVGQDGVGFNGTGTVLGGFNGGGSNTVTCVVNCAISFLGGSGGGSSDVRTSADALADRLLVAGGGGGAGVGGAPSGDPGTGGDSASAAKSVTGGFSAIVTCSGGGAGTLLGPGAAGSGHPACVSGQPGDPGGLTGGGGGEEMGAGGGGYFGGGAGAAAAVANSGGGGGSDYPDPASPPAGISNVTVTDGVQSGNGLITVTYATPTAVTFASASATRTAKGVLVRWRTGTEAELFGFQVYRSRGHSWERLTRSLIVARGSVAGASYRFLDRKARRGVAYRYRIKALNRDGTTSWFGPMRVT